MAAFEATHAPGYADLVDEFGASVYSLALIITGSCELAGETTEAVFSQIRSWPDLNGGRQAITRLAHECAVRRVRAKRASAPESAVAPLPQRTSPMLDQLSAEELAALEVTYFQGRTLHQAAEILDQPIPMLVARIRSALEVIHRVRTDRPARQAPSPVPLQREH